jgi:hypothetical protein
MNPDDIEKRRKQIEAIEGEEGMEVAHDSAAFQLASLLGCGREFADPTGSSEDTWYLDTHGIAQYAAGRLAQHTARIQTQARADLAMGYIEKVLFADSGALKKGTFLVDDDGSIRDTWKGLVDTSGSDTRSAIAALAQTDEGFQTALIRAGDAMGKTRSYYIGD